MKAKLFYYLLIIISCLNTGSVLAQHNEFKINDALYRYMIKVQNNLKNKGVGLCMIDTFYAKASEIKDVKAQCLALYFKVKYYSFNDDIEGEKREFDRVAPLILRTPYLQYYFGAWTNYIIDNMNRGKHDIVLSELSKYQERAFELKNDYGVMNSYMLLGDYYMNTSHFSLALPQFKKALEYAQSKHVGDISSLYSNISQCLMWLRRWDEAEKACFQGLSLVSDEMKVIQPYTLLLSIYCRSEHQDSVKINKTYDKLQQLLSRHPLLGKNVAFYSSSMFDYYQYYRHDEKRADYYLKKDAFRFDELTQYLYEANKAEKVKDYRSSSDYYQRYGDRIAQSRLENESFLLSSFVPHMEYQKVENEKNAQLRHKAQMELQEAVDNELLLDLSEERDRAKILQRFKEQDLLKSQLELRKLTWQHRDKLLQQERIKSEQRKKLVESNKDKDYWRMLFFSLLIMALLILMGIYAINQYVVRRKLKREKAKAENSEQIKSLFFQNMNHEIRNPLNAIIGFNELLNSKAAKTISDKEKTDFIAMIESNSNLLLKLVNDVLDLSNFEAGTYKLSFAETDIHQLCHVTLESVRGRQNENVQLLLKTSPDHPYMLYTDAQRLQQVLINFLTNACKYTDTGTITLSYEALPDKVRFAVTDTGRGVKEEDAEKVFDRFQMLDKAKRGTGLGLHICRIISKLLHGRVYVDTNYKEGARFVFDHPIKGLFTLLIALCCSFIPMKAQNNPLHIQNNLYHYYLKLDKYLNIPVGGALADTMFVMAQKSGDVEAQCLALAAKTKHYRYGHNDAALLNAFAQCRDFAISHKRYKYVFKAWTHVIKYYLSQNRFKEAMQQLQQYQNVMRKLNDPYGISMYFYEVGNFFTLQQQNATALSYYLKAMNYWTDERCSIYTLIAQSYYSLKDYRKGILYAKKALGTATTQVMKFNPMVILLKCYCHGGDAANATNVMEELKELQHENVNRVSFSRFYEALYCYYHYIKKDNDNAMEALLAAGNEYNPEYFGSYYYYLKKYEASSKYYKEYADLSTKWLRTDWNNLFDSYISKFDYDQANRERNRLQLANIQLQLQSSHRRKELLLAQREKSILELQHANLVTRQKKSALDVQNMMLAQQQTDINKQRIVNAGIETQREINEQRDDWRMVAISFALLFVIASFIFLFFYLHRKMQRLRGETIKAEATERAKNRFYQRVSERIQSPLSTIVNLNKQLNSNETFALTEMERLEMMRQLSLSSKSLNIIVNNVLDISKLESGTYKMQISEVNVDELCHLVMRNVSEELPSNVKLLFDPRRAENNYSSALLVSTDQSRLQFILTLYLTNACHHTSFGSITLAYEQLPNMIRFSVTDTGRMLSSEEAAMIFSRHLSDNREHRLGLGMYLVRLSAKMIQAKAYADSTGNVNGARFYLDIPLSL